jgi:hemerythrin-like metal-binding protein
MPTLLWSDDFQLGVAAMDATHREFITLLAEVEDAPDAALLARWSALVEHTQQHFDSEDRHMLATRFAATNCHSGHHRMVLQVLREGQALGAKGDLGPIRQIARELATWFPQHAATMDTALALHLQHVGYDPASGAIARAAALPAELIHGCGGASCSPAETTAEASA